MFRRLRLAFLGLLLCLWAGPALAADGDTCSEVTSVDDTFTGNFNVRCRYLCESSVGSTTRTCGVYDLAQDGIGMPSVAIIEVGNAVGCDAGWTVNVDTGPQSATAAGNLDLHDAVNLDATTTRGIFTWPSSTLDRYVHADFTSASCTNFDLIIQLYYERY
jgi:hypothetical protein